MMKFSEHEFRKYKFSMKKDDIQVLKNNNPHARVMLLSMLA